MGDRILVIGGINMDLVITMEDMPVVGETILGNGLSYIPGGKAANQAYAIGNLGGNVTMLGCIGDDSFGDTVCNNLQQHGVNVTRLKRIAGESTGLAFIYVNKDGNNSIVVVPGANNYCNVEYLKSCDEEFILADYILMPAEIPFDALEYAIKRGHELGKKVILNPAPAPDSLSPDILSKLYCITPNETELEKLTKINSEDVKAVAHGAQKLLDDGAASVIVTLGAKGCLYKDKDTEKFIPTPDFKPVDTTAAGDCFNAAFLVGLSKELGTEQALQFANAASAISVTRKGAQSSLPTLSEVEKVLENETKA